MNCKVLERILSLPSTLLHPFHHLDMPTGNLNIAGNRMLQIIVSDLPDLPPSALPRKQIRKFGLLELKLYNRNVEIRPIGKKKIPHVQENSLCG